MAPTPDISPLDVATLYELRFDDPKRPVWLRDAVGSRLAPVVNWRGGTPVKVVDTGGSLTAILLGNEHVRLDRLVYCLLRGRWVDEEIVHVDADPYNCHPRNLVLASEVHLTIGLEDEIEDNALERRAQLEREERAIKEQLDAQEKAAQAAREARDAREDKERQIGAAELARRSGAPAGRVAVLEAIAQDEADANMADDPTSGLAPYEAMALPLPAPSESMTTHRSVRRPRVAAD